MSEMTAARWLVLDNLKQGWDYRLSLHPDQADAAYLWCVRNEYVRDGKITPLGVKTLQEHSWSER